MPAWIAPLAETLAQPVPGLAVLFAAALIAATLLPLGSEPVLLALLGLQPDLAWPAVLVATLGNTLGSAITFLLGRGAHALLERARARPTEQRALSWLRRWGPPVCGLAFLPGIGDPICAVAGWLRLPLRQCLAWAAAGKFLRYAAVAALFQPLLARVGAGA